MLEKVGEIVATRSEDGIGEYNGGNEVEVSIIVVSRVEKRISEV